MGTKRETVITYARSSEQIRCQRPSSANRKLLVKVVLRVGPYGRRQGSDLTDRRGADNQAQRCHPDRHGSCGKLVTKPNHVSEFQRLRLESALTADGKLVESAGSCCFGTTSEYGSNTMRQEKYVSLAVFCGFVLFTASVQADQWGDLTGRFLYEGEPPVRKAIEITKDNEYCAKCNLREEHLVVDPATQGVANVAVWLLISSRDPTPPIHESYTKTENAVVNLNSTNCRIDPHVCLVRTTQSLLIRNTDSIADGLKIDTFRNPPLNILLPPEGEIRRELRAPERVPVPVGCPVHPWESGWLLVREDPYMAASNAEGRFQIKNLPVGEWTFQFWHEMAGYLSKVELQGKEVSWRRGRSKIDIKPGVNDLGEIQLAAALFQ